MSGSYTPTVSPELQGVPAATLQLWLGQAQTALHTLQIGGMVATASYSQGDGQKTVTYTRANMGALRVYVRELQQALGNIRARRPIGVQFGTATDRPYGAYWWRGGC